MATARVDSVYVPKLFKMGDKDVSQISEDMKKINKAHKGDMSGRGVIYLGHIPAGFYEPQMKKFFSQFGRVTRLRLSRSKKTGRSKGYAFVEFLHKDVAKTVADTMNNYLMFMKLLKCEFLPAEKVHADTFKGCNKRFSTPKAAAVATQRHNSLKTESQEKRARGRQAKKLKKLAECGIEVDLKLNEKVSQSPVPETINTPGGKLRVLKEDASDAEVTFKTPPGTIKSSRLAVTPRVKSSSTQKSVKRLRRTQVKNKD
ncbi:MKI67 FHA domain-interacting nucleolar phosphoprotein-like isoform X2 [Babylonia areolata]|uniref:MKI67 FHA domain-interacting nucleolar phosphoprotein-like isoform X2 n=1 Tax=Babylonia areolata TaxID=304850 RepID=UPI003FCFB7BC